MPKKRLSLGEAFSGATAYNIYRNSSAKSSSLAGAS